MKTREIFLRDPAVTPLMNNGQARLDETQTLREELSNFVCEGQYASGLLRILESYLRHLSGTSQPAAWVSGFYGSGKSHLLKMLAHLWINTEFEDGATARALVPSLSDELQAALRELDIKARRHGGLRAAWGSLPAGGGPAVRLTVLGTVLRAMGLPEGYPQARFCLYLRRNGFLDAVKSAIEKKGKAFGREINNLYVSPDLHDALITVDPGFKDRAQVRDLLRRDFPIREDTSTAELLEVIREVLESDGRLPCTLIALDEVQLFIGDSSERATQVVEVAEALSKQLDGRVLLVGAGQTALSSTAQLEKLRARFTIPVELSDTDVEVVTRRVLLQKRADAAEPLRRILESHAGEIDRQLAGTRIGPRAEDRASLVEDYPLLPARRRFWEAVLRAVDAGGVQSQLRTQLRIVYEALRALADAPLGAIVPADFLFEQIQPDLLQRGVLLREIDETIRKLADGTDEGKLRGRICGLVFLIRKLPRDGGADAGVRATVDLLGDLLVTDLAHDGARVRSRLPALLRDLVEKGILMDVDGEYNLQTRESSEWEKDFQSRLRRLASRDPDVHAARQTLLQGRLERIIDTLKLQQGVSKEERRLDPCFGEEDPKLSEEEVQVWVRDEWSASHRDVLEAARAAGPESARVFVFVPKAHADDLRQRLIAALAAMGTLDQRGAPTTDEGREARDAMETRRKREEEARDAILAEIVGSAKVYKGGGVEVHGSALEEKAREAADAALGRLFPRFRDADHKGWRHVIERARKGDDSPLEAVDWTGALENHPVVAEVLRAIGSGCEGRTLRERFRKAPYGWPQDALDGVLIALHAAGRLEVRHKGVVLSPGQLDQGKISSAEFRSEAVVLSAQDKLRLRGLFQGAGVEVRAGDDLSPRGAEYLRKLEEVAAQAGGEAPLPTRPSTEILAQLRSIGGQEQLSGMLAQSEKLEALRRTSQSAADLASKRLPVWTLLQDLLAHADGLPEAADLEAQADAIRTGRALLEPSDRVAPLLKRTAAVLRGAVKSAYEGWKGAHAAEIKRLEADPSWKRLSEADRATILVGESLLEAQSPRMASDQELLACLGSTPLSSWREKTDALPQRGARAALKAARLLEPKTQRIRLTSATLRTQEEVKVWVKRTEEDLLEKLGEGPIVVG